MLYCSHVFSLILHSVSVHPIESSVTEDWGYQEGSRPRNGGCLPQHHCYRLCPCRCSCGHWSSYWSIRPNLLSSTSTSILSIYLLDVSQNRIKNGLQYGVYTHICHAQVLKWYTVEPLYRGRHWDQQFCSL